MSYTTARTERSIGSEYRAISVKSSRPPLRYSLSGAFTSGRFGHVGRLIPSRKQRPTVEHLDENSVASRICERDVLQNHAVPAFDRGRHIDEAVTRPAGTGDRDIERHIVQTVPEFLRFERPIELELEQVSDNRAVVRTGVREQEHFDRGREPGPYQSAPASFADRFPAVRLAVSIDRRVVLPLEGGHLEVPRPAYEMVDHELVRRLG